MNKMKKMYTVWGIIVVLIFVLLTVFGFLYKNKSSEYKELENKLADASKKYVEIEFLYPNTGERLKVSLDKLIDNELINELKINDEICTGYAIISKPSTVYKYKGYVSCHNYKTKGYEN